MNQEEVFEKLKDIIVDKLGIEEELVTEDASFLEDLGADSLDIVEMIMAIEDEFGIEVPDEDAEGIKTVGEAVKYISNKLSI